MSLTIDNQCVRCKAAEVSAKELCGKCYQSEYRKKHIDKHREYCKNYYLSNRETLLSASNQYSAEHKEEQRKRGKEYYQANLVSKRKYARDYGAVHRTQRAAYYKQYKKQRMQNDPVFRLTENHRRRIRLALTMKKSIRTMELIGCSVDQLKLHLETKFTPGMTWDNYGKWHVDHIKPCCAFDLTNEVEQRTCFHYSNLQPLWTKDNLSKISEDLKQRK